MINLSKYFPNMNDRADIEGILRVILSWDGLDRNELVGIVAL